MKTFEKDEAISLLARPQIDVGYVLDMCKKEIKYGNDKISCVDFINTYNFVAPEKSMRYMRKSDINDIIERKHFIENMNSIGAYKKGLHDKHSTILDVVLPAKTKNGKVVGIRASNELLMNLMIEMVYRKVYKDVKMEKAIREIVKEAKLYNIDIDFNNPYNRKKLEEAYSSGKRNDVKMLKEISKVFSVVMGKDGYYRINAVVKQFNIADAINQINQII